ncbi:sugar-transfer associated ATP-grasp domain-containing protein [Flavihumibacter sp. CACIAM 22H1]|uniref:sugar-transfer associated ATP-grasp domain-containing protein n=1 Tax=Flavihumibacter sp. CACIAM 22H1 TaxID=1812911 RepID=UPI0007A82CDE|nr:sugar-transfer associated ATP-grasp domain-containing protein [Flavihumibacter sp. CACIAM 22H1]KYP15115.1 MAG: hypothetical protein A1D16_12450 [Flavihumibacter sp. CACIAM 22H1]
MKRLIYLFYYLKTTDFQKLKKFNQFAVGVSGKSSLNLHLDSIISVFKFNTALLDYYHFRFFEQTDTDRMKWAGTGFMYEYQLRANPKSSRNLLEDKILFLKHFSRLNARRFYTLNEVLDGGADLQFFFTHGSGKAVLKGSRGQVGAEVNVIDTDQFDPLTLPSFMKQNGYDLLEEYVIQHPDLMNLSPSGLNTIRVFTELKEGQVIFLGARLRITINSPVDNMAAGNPAAPVDIKSGKVIGPAVFSDISKQDISVHPVTKISIVGFQVPFWERVIEMVTDATLDAGGNKSIGWDVAVSAAGPELIEGNHNWCKLLWQLPVKSGLKSILTQ